MNISVNGDSTTVPDGTSVAQLLEGLALGSQRLAVEVNEDLVPRSLFAERRLADGDKVEIIHAVGGG